MNDDAEAGKQDADSPQGSFSSFIPHPSSFLPPLPYQRRLLEHLRATEREVWDWFASGKVKQEHFEATRLQLLRSAYRLDRETHAGLYRLAEQAGAALGQDRPITLYQEQTPKPSLNAGLVWMPEENHVIFSGPVAEHLTERELLAVFGHELAHAALWARDEGAYQTVDRVLEALASDAHADAAHRRTQQLFQLYTEVYCDRGALQAVPELEVTVSALVKLTTGLREVNAASYLAQADEVLAVDPTASKGVTHPETVIRARSLRLWSETGAEAEESVRAMIEGPPTLERLDLLQQVEVTRWTQEFVHAFIRPAWLRSEAVAAHARKFFDDGELPPAVGGEARGGLEGNAGGGSLKAGLQLAGLQLGEYFCYVLLDFVTVDPELREPALAHAYLTAKELGMETQFLDVARKELELRKRQIDALQAEAVEIIARAEAAGSAT